MNLKLGLIAVSLMLPALWCGAQTLSHTGSDGRVVTVTALGHNVIKVTNLAPGQKAVAGTASVIDNSGYDGGEVAGNTLTLTGMSATFAPDGTLTVKNGKGAEILTDKGVRSIDGSNGVAIDIVGNGSLYGAGERGHKLNLRGDTLVMYNRQNYGYTGSDPRISQMGVTMPLFLSADGYGVVFDDFAAAKMVLGNHLEYVTESPAPVSYYVVTSDDGSLAGVTEAMTSLTGRQELPPFWSMGYITSKYGYKTQAETEGVIDTLKRLGYPVDGIVLDLYWYGKEQDMGRLAWDPEQWPDPERMLDSLKRRGVNLVAISQPFVLRNGKAIDNYNELAPKGIFIADSTGTNTQNVVIWVGEGGMFDMSNPDTQRWLTDRYRSLTNTGITGWWGDLGEPEAHPESAMHANGLPARLYHNRYGNDWSSIIYNLFKSDYPDTRLMTMMRAGTTGLQRYDVFPWTTDVSRSWGGLEPQITLMQQSGLSGLGYMGHDVGGFAVDQDHAYMPELYVRWLQLGTFSPILRTHAQQNAEPYLYPQYSDIIQQLIKDRYRWLPYNYTLAWENAVKGYPLVRPLEFASTNPTGQYDNIRDEYLWGSEVLMAPVLTEGAHSRSVVFPATSPLWYDINNPGVTYKGGTTATVDAPLSVLPMFARAGAFIPTADYAMGNTADYRTDLYTVNYYPAEPGTTSSYTLFEDDRITPSAKSDNHGLEITFTAKRNADYTLFTIAGKGQYKGMIPDKTITLIVNDCAKAPKTVKIDGKIAPALYDAERGTVTVIVPFTVGATTSILIK